MNVSPMAQGLILVVEDEPGLANMIRDNLEAEGFQVSVAPDGASALAAQRAKAADLIVLDLMLPDMGGFDILRALRQREDQTPVLILTARSGQEDRLQGLNYGADDYMAKPFALMELLARIQAILRRAKGNAASARVIQSGPFSIDLLQHSVTRGGRDLQLTLREFRFLEVLVKHPGKVHSREELLNIVSDADSRPGPRAVDVHIANLRKKLGDTGAKPYIETLQREGYRWTKLQTSTVR